VTKLSKQYKKETSIKRIPFVIVRKRLTNGDTMKIWRSCCSAACKLQTPTTDLYLKILFVVTLKNVSLCVHGLKPKSEYEKPIMCSSFGDI
jgi:hypothetical protein